MLKSNLTSHLLYFTDSALFGPNKQFLSGLNADLDGTFSLNTPNSTNVTFTGGFYNFFIVLASSSDVLNTR